MQHKAATAAARPGAGESGAAGWHTRLVDVPAGWAEVDGALEREFSFDGFPEAVAFVNRVAELAEAERHHPDIALSYRTVTLRWWTHSAGGVTPRDRELAVRSADLA